MLILQVASVFLVAWVDSDEEERRLKEVALSSGLITPSSSTSGVAGTASKPGNAAVGIGILQHVSAGLELLNRVQRVLLVRRWTGCKQMTLAV